MAKTKKVVRTRRRERKNVVNGQAHIQSTFNNTIISISDIDGNGGSRHLCNEPFLYRPLRPDDASADGTRCAAAG